MMRRFSTTHTEYAYSSDHKPIGTVQAGERFEVECIDTWSHYFRTPSDFTPENYALARASQWAVTGPIAVQDALPGRSGGVTIHEVNVVGPGIAVYGGYQIRRPGRLVG